MKERIIRNRSRLRSVETFEGERIEQKIERITLNKEPITDGAPIIYTEKKDGVQPAYNIRTDRHELAIEAMDKVQKIRIAERENKAKLDDVPNKLEGGTPTEN